MGKQSDCLPVFRFKMPQIHIVEAETVGAVGNGGQAFAFCDFRNVAVSYGCAVMPAISILSSLNVTSRSALQI